MMTRTPTSGARESKASDVTSERERTIADALSVVMSHAPMKCMQPANWRFARNSAGVAATRLLLQARRFRICNNPALSEFRILHSAFCITRFSDASPSIL